METDVEINENTVAVPIKVVRLEIDGTSVELERDHIHAMLIRIAKDAFLESYDLNLTGEQLQYLRDTLPDSIYWESNHCGVCDGDVEFDQSDIPDWNWDEANSRWVCPSCREQLEEGDMEETGTEKVIKEASEKAEQIQQGPKGFTCLVCERFIEHPDTTRDCCDECLADSNRAPGDEPEDNEDSEEDAI